jgi:predicted permease
MGLPVIAELFGDLGIFYYTFFLVPVRIGYYALSEPLMTPQGVEGTKTTPAMVVKKALLSPQLIAVVVGLVFWVNGWKLPEAIQYCVKSLSSICSPLALLLCGMIVAEYDFKSLVNLKYLRLPFLRTVVMPALFFLLSRLLLMMGVEDLLCQIFVVYTALPVASLLPVYSIKYDPDPDNHLDAAGACILSVILSAVTIPVWFMLL